MPISWRDSTAMVSLLLPAEGPLPNLRSAVLTALVLLTLSFLGGANASRVIIRSPPDAIIPAAGPPEERFAAAVIDLSGEGGPEDDVSGDVSVAALGVNANMMNDRRRTDSVARAGLRGGAAGGLWLTMAG